MPVETPRTLVVPTQQDAFREYALRGDGAAFFDQLRAGLDEVMDEPFPDEPPYFGDPSPEARTAEKVELWRQGHDIAGWVGNVAEAAALVWIATGEDRYLEKAKEMLLKSSRWDPEGTSGVGYNDEAHFRLWRKLPLVYDQVRDHFSPAEREEVLAVFRIRGSLTHRFLLDHDIDGIRRNTIPPDATSHPIRFMSMTGLAGLALWDDLPEAREWFALAERFYREQFTPWGGDDGGWAEGLAYWRAVIEHGRFQDALLALGHPDAWAGEFWRQTGYFPVYFLQPYQATSFGDLPVRGQINLQAQISEFLVRAGRRFDDGYLLSFAALNRTARNQVMRQGLNLDRGRIYPNGMEHLLRHFQESLDPKPEPAPLGDLPQARHFEDVGWVSMHSALGQPNDDIMLSFKSSPYGSFSHSHADQNAFILNAYGEGLAINSGYREYHRSPHHARYTRQTRSKNAILIGGHGQEAQSTEATGRITRFQEGDRFVVATGDATQAYRTGPEGENVLRATRDIAMIDRRYFVVRDVIEVAEARPVSWLLHAEAPIEWDATGSAASIRRERASLGVRLLGAAFPSAEAWSGFPIPVEPQYVEDGYIDQHHFSATAATAARHEIWAVLWPDREAEKLPLLKATLNGGWLLVERPDRKRDAIALGDEQIEIESR